MTLKWSNTNKAGSASGIKTLVYGAAGVGKTTLCSTAPKPLIISAEGGMLSLRDKSIPVLEVSSLQDVYDVLKWLLSGDKHVNAFQTICLDSISEIAEVVLTNAKRKSKDPRQAYGTLIDDMIPLVKAFRDLPGKHVVITCKETTVKNELSGAITAAPSTPGKAVANDLPYLFDEVMHLAVGKDAEGKDFRYLRTQPDQFTVAKDRSGALEVIEAPDLTYLFNKM